MGNKISGETIGELRHSLEEQARLFSDQQETESKAYQKGSDRKPWVVYDDDLEDMERTFSEVLPYGNLEHYLAKRFSNKALTGIELGGPGSNFFGGFNEVKFEKSVGVTVKDLRNKYQTKDQENSDKQRSHSVIEADIFSPEALKKLDAWLNGKQADFIIERMQGGWGRNELNMPLFAKYLARYYQRLGDNGVMLLQTPFVDRSKRKSPATEANIKSYLEWLTLFRQTYSNSLDITAPSAFVMRLAKQKNAPKKIDTLKF